MKTQAEKIITMENDRKTNWEIEIDYTLTKLEEIVLPDREYTMLVRETLMIYELLDCMKNTSHGHMIKPLLETYLHDNINDLDKLSLIQLNRIFKDTLTKTMWLRELTDRITIVNAHIPLSNNIEAKELFSYLQRLID